MHLIAVPAGTLLARLAVAGAPLRISHLRGCSGGSALTTMSIDLRVLGDLRSGSDAAAVDLRARGVFLYRPHPRASAERGTLAPARHGVAILLFTANVAILRDRAAVIGC